MGGWAVGWVGGFVSGLVGECVGRRVWWVAGGICQQEGGVEHQLTLTTCTSGDQFTCDDGTCVSMDQVIQ